MFPFDLLFSTRLRIVLRLGTAPLTKQSLGSYNRLTTIHENVIRSKLNVPLLRSDLVDEMTFCTDQNYPHDDNLPPLHSYYYSVQNSPSPTCHPTRPRIVVDNADHNLASNLFGPDVFFISPYTGNCSLLLFLEKEFLLLRLKRQR